MFISRRTDLETGIVTLQTHVANLKKCLVASQERVSGLRDVGDRLEERYRIVRPRNGELGVHPSTRRRIMLERSIAEKNQEITDMERQMHADSDEIRRIKCKIEDQKCLHDMLRKKISEARRVERPNIPSLCKTLDLLKKKERAAKDKLKSVTFEESALPQFILDRKDVLNAAPSELELENLRKEVASLKSRAISEHRLNRAKTKLVATDEIIQLKTRERELIDCEKDVHLQIVDVQNRIVQLRRTLNAQKLTPPEVIAVPIGVPRF
jgi:hypothetical protein